MGTPAGSLCLPRTLLEKKAPIASTSGIRVLAGHQQGAGLPCALNTRNAHAQAILLMLPI